jgi:hypothetical protein
MFWVTGYIHTAINDGPGCLSLRCADPPCEAIVGEDLVYDLVSEDDRRKYTHYLLRSYVEDNRKVRFFCCLFMCWIHRGWDRSKNEAARSLADWVCKLLVGARTLNIGTLVCPFLSGLDYLQLIWVCSLLSYGQYPVFVAFTIFSQVCHSVMALLWSCDWWTEQKRHFAG